MPDTSGTQRDMGRFEATLESLGEQLDAMRTEGRDRARDADARADQFFRALGEQQRSIETVNGSVKTLKQAVDSERELTRERFKAVWRWIAPLGGAGAVGSALVWLSRAMESS